VNFSLGEIIVIVLVALLVIKPEQLPDVAFSLGRFAKSMRRMYSRVKDEMNGLIDTVEKSEEKPLTQKVVEHKSIE
jgi:Sec-independent protein translocase protein TatA